MSGRYAMTRGWMDNSVLRTPEEKLAWLWLIENACWKPTRFNVRGKAIELQRGQICASREQLNKAWGWSNPSAVQRFLIRLKIDQMIDQETDQGRSIITICNYNKHQFGDDEIDPKTDPKTDQKVISKRRREESKEDKKQILTSFESVSSAGEKISDSDPDLFPDTIGGERAGGVAVTRTKTRKAAPEKKAVPLSEKNFHALLPEHAPVEHWDRWLEFRRSLRRFKEPTADQVKIWIKNLDAWAELGKSWKRQLEDAISMEWPGFKAPAFGKGTAGNAMGSGQGQQGGKQGWNDAIEQFLADDR